MESPPPLMPAPVFVEEKKGKSVVVSPPEVSSARDLAVIGYIITLLLSIPWIILSLAIGGIGVAAYLGYLILPPTLPPLLLGFPFVGPFIAFLIATLTPSYLIYIGLGGGGLIVALLFLGAIYFGMVRSISKGQYEKARNSSLFWGILFIIPVFFVIFSSLLTGAVIALVPAFFFLLTYGKLGEAIAKYGPVAVMGEAVPGMSGVAPAMAGMPVPITGMPMPPGPGMPPSPGPMQGPPRNPQCPTCGQELYYDANHRRWYCQNCDNPGHR